MIRVLALAGGLIGAGAASQFPEFSQQYTQRLGGTVSALEQVVADFDASAQAEGLSRADALASMVGSDFVARRRADMERTIERHDRLRRDLDMWQAATAFTRAAHVPQMDTSIAADVWAVYEPAVPITPAGGMFAGIGFLSGWGALLGCFALIGRVIPRRKPRPA